MFPNADAAKLSVLRHGAVDWIDLTVLLMEVRKAIAGDALEAGYPAAGSISDASSLAAARRDWLIARQQEAFPYVIALVKELLRDRLVEVGTVDHHGFSAWRGSLDELYARIDHEADLALFPVQVSDLFWLQNTDLGDRVARSENSTA